MVYSVTQLAMWLSKMEFDAVTSGETEGEELPISESQKGDAGKDRKTPKAPVTLAERLRRGMTVEMADDLEQLLKKGHAVLQERKTDDFSQVLLNFFKEHLRG
jgi:nuclear pore complex protein Nup188